MVKVEVPPLGESISEALVIELTAKKVGDFIASGEVLCKLETDKVAIEVSATSAGVISGFAVKQGDVVVVGQLIAEIDETVSAAQVASLPAKETISAPRSVASDHKSSPAAMKMMRESDLGPANVRGTGRDSMITKADVLGHLKASVGQVAVQPCVPVAEVAELQSQGGRVRKVKMSKLRQKIAERLKFSQNNAAMLTTFNEIDMSAVVDLRNKYKDSFQKKHGVKLGFMSFFVKAVVEALKMHPEINAEIDGEWIVYKDYYDIGVAVGTDRGLVVPVLRNVESLSMYQIEKQIVDYGQKAKDGMLTVQEMSGGTFTISNGGTYGSLFSTPIINPPQSGILGMHNIVWRPVVVEGASNEKKIEPRPMMYVALSYDHRIVDGKGAVTFLVALKEMLEDPHKLILGV